MKTFLSAFVITCISLLGAKSATAQDVKCDSVYTLAEQMPLFGKDQKDFFNYLNKNLEVKKPCKPSELKRIIFTVNKEGKIMDVEVVGVNEKCKEDLVNQIMSFPSWTPGKDHGEPVCVRIIMPTTLRQHKQ